MNIWLKKTLYGLLPGRCVLCTGATHRFLDLCVDCESDLPKLDNPCWRCGLTVPIHQDLCAKCIIYPPPFSHCFAALAYGPPVDKLIGQFKNHQKIIIGKILAQLLADAYLKHHLIFPDYWIPVPLHKDRLKSRGFNQALEIAEVVSDNTCIPINSRLCRRIGKNQEQKLLSAKQRTLNTKNVFVLDQALHGETIGIVDDVVTTTSTVSALSHLLLENGAAEVQVICLARTPSAQTKRL